MSTFDFDAAAPNFDAEFRIRRAEGVVAELAKQVPLDTSLSVLDFGCGTGLVGFELLPLVGRLTLADSSSGMLDEARSKISKSDAGRVETLLLEPENSEFSGEYDLIVSLMTLHHIPDAEGTVELLASSLSPGGYLALSDLDREDGSFHGPDAEVHRGFDRREVRGWLANAGLSEIRDSTPWTMHKELEGGDREYPLFLITGRRWRE